MAAARVCGPRPLGIRGRHFLPTASAPSVVQATLLLGTAIVTEAALWFLGVGVQPPTPSWGSMLRTGSQYLEVAPWIAFAPGTAIFLTVLAVNFVGDGLRRAARPPLARPPPRVRGAAEGTGKDDDQLPTPLTAREH